MASKWQASGEERVFGAGCAHESSCVSSMVQRVDSTRLTQQKKVLMRANMSTCGWGGRADDVYLLCAREGATMRVGEAIGVGEAATWGATVYGRGTQKICDGRR